jgi:hypothetical protein
MNSNGVHNRGEEEYLAGGKIISWIWRKRVIWRGRE